MDHPDAVARIEEELLFWREGLDRKRGVAPTKWNKQQPTERQRLFLSCEQSEAFYGGAAGGGKSSALLMAALEYVDVPGYSALILRRTYQDLSKPGALMDRAREWLVGSGARWNEQKKQWRFPSGAVISFGYLENESDKYQYQGSEYQFCGFDELTQFNESQYLYLFSRLRRLQNSDVPLRMRSASNPGGVGSEWVQARFIPDQWTPLDGRELKVFDKEGRAFVPARLVDNPHLDQAGYEQSLQNLDEVTRAQLLEGDWQVKERGNIYPMWSDGYNGHHVITWEQFAGVFKTARIPSHWLGACGQDWGFDPDPCATVWNFTAAANSPMPGAIFVPRILTSRAQIPDAVGEQMKLIESAEEWGGRVQYRVMSHEASSQLETYRVKQGLHFQKCKPDQHGGIAQMQHAIRLRQTDQPHPFKPWLNGTPNYFLIVPPEQLSNPKGDEGLALLRAEFAQYRYTEQRVSTHLGAARIVPYDFFNHYMDAQRYVAAKWFVRAAPLTEREQIEAAIPEAYQIRNAPHPNESRDSWALDGWEMARAVAVDKAKKEIGGKQVDRNDQWEPASPFDNVSGGFWNEDE